MAEEHGPLLQGWALQWQQLRFMVWKQWAQKRRGYLQTLAEILSPIMLMGALVWAYHLTDIIDKPERIYAGEMQYLAKDAANSLLYSLRDSGAIPCLGGPLGAWSSQLPPLNLSQQAQQQFEQYQTVVLPLEGPDPVHIPPQLHKEVQHAAKVFVDSYWSAVANDPVMQAQLDECSGRVASALGRSLMEIYMAFIHNKGPLPVFSLDEYLLLSRTLNELVARQPEVGDMLYNVRRDFGFNWLGNLLGTGKLAFTPNTPEVQALAQYLNQTHRLFKGAFYGCAERSELEKMAAEGYNFWAVVDFAHLDAHPGGSADYTIRMSFRETPETYVPINKFEHHHVSNKYKMYWVSGFFSIEAAINAYVLGLDPSTEGSVVVPQTALWNATAHPMLQQLNSTVQQQAYSVWAAAFPTPHSHFNPFYQAVGPLLGLLMCLSLLLPLAMLIRGMVEEKENRVREVLVIMGLRPWALQASWIIAYGAIFVIVSLLAVLVTGTTFLSHTSKSLLLVYLIVFCMSELAFGVMLSTFFSRAKVSAIVGPLAHFMTVMPRYAFYKTAMGQAVTAKLAVSLLSPSAFTFGMDLIAEYEGASRGMQWSDMWADPFPLGCTLFMMMLDTALYMALAAYFDKVIPSGYGPALPPWFLCQPRFWRQWVRPHKQLMELSHPAPGEGTPLLQGGAPNVLQRESPIVDIQHLWKSFPNGVHAVRDLSLQMHRGQITALLGHNGAGKSTSVSLMTGLLTPTSGDVLIAGHSIVHDTHAARQSLGLCPQHEVLLSRLTVKEHLVLLAAIKGVSGMRRCGTAASTMRATVGLTPADEAAAAATLSGGMKRKLQMGMALIGGSQVVVADEPTSGMDPTARRALWALLRAVKPTCSVLITTHYMDEADLLADNVVILSSGRLRAQGAPMALKDAHGGDYTLTITLNPTASATKVSQGVSAQLQPAQSIHSDSIGAGTVQGAVPHVDLTASMAGICAAVAGIVPEVSVVRRAGTELVLRLPAQASHLFPKILETLEHECEALHISHCSISMPTLEEVFLNLTTQREPVAKGHSPASAGSHSASQQARLTANLQSTGPGRHVDMHHDGMELTQITHAASDPHSVRESDAMLLAPGSIAVHVDATSMGAQAGSWAPAADMSDIDAWKQRLIRPGGNSTPDPSPAKGSIHKAAAATSNGIHHGDDAARLSLPVPEQGYGIFTAHGWRSFKAMLTKRARIAGRDWKGLLYLFLLPVVVVAFTLTILLLNIDPTGPSLVLSLHSLEQYTPVPQSFNPAPGILTGCLGPVQPLQSSQPEAKAAFAGWMPKYHYHGKQSCFNGLSLQDIKDVAGSVNMSTWLLGQQLNNASMQPPQYAALAWNDPTVLNASNIFAAQLQDLSDELMSDFLALNIDSDQLSNWFQYVQLLSAVPAGTTDAVAYATTKLSPEFWQKNILPWLTWSVSDDAAFPRPPVRRLAHAISSGSIVTHLGTGSHGGDVPSDSDVRQDGGDLKLKQGRRRLHGEGNSSRSSVASGPGVGTDKVLRGLDQLDSLASGAMQPGADVSSLLQSVLQAGWANSPLAAFSNQNRGVQHILHQLNQRMQQPPLTVLFNATSQHAMMAAFTDLQQAVANIDAAGAARHAAAVHAAGKDHIYDWQGEQQSEDISTRNRTLRVTNHPLPLTNTETLAIDTFLSILAAVFVMIPFCYLAGAYCVSPVSEARTGSRQLQVASGCPRLVYWAGSFVWDLGMHAAVSITALATFAAFGDAATTGSLMQAGATLVLLFGYGLGCIPLSYAMSFGFRSPSTGQVTVSAACFVLGFMFVVGSESMKGIETCRAFQRVAVHFCRLLPPFNLGEGLISLSTYNLFRMLAQDLEPQAGSSQRQQLDSIIPADAIPAHTVPSSPFEWQIIGRNLCALYGSSLAYFLLVWGMDTYQNDPYLEITIKSQLQRTTAKVLSFISDMLAKVGCLRLATWFSNTRGGVYMRVQGTAQDVEMQQGLHSSTVELDDGASLLPTMMSDLRTKAQADHAQLAVTMDIEDSDVVAERSRVCGGPATSYAQPGKAPDVLSIRQLSKVYDTRPPKVAVQDLSLGVAPGERFGFLGANGAGKSSTLRILSGQSAPSGGEVLVRDHSVVSAEGAATAQQRLVGYCPQVDPLLELLTAWEQVCLFAKLKGMHKQQVQREVQRLLGRVGLPQHMWHRPSGTLSGGNKRKVSLAMALVGSPALVLLDEPSSGMDPGARRLMWDAILSATQQEQQPGATGSDTCQAAALLLTTHYLEEAEALCDRVAIMNKGRLLCLGSAAHLKAKHGGMYSIELQCATTESAAAQDPTTTTRRSQDAQSRSMHAGLGASLLRGNGAAFSSTDGSESGGHDAVEGLKQQSHSQPLDASRQRPTSAHSHHSLASVAGVGLLSQAERQEVLVAEISSQLPGLQVVEVAWGRVRATLPLTPSTPPLHTIFKVLEHCKAQLQLGLLSYSVSQPSLESVFLTVCGHKLDEQGEYVE